MNKSAIYHRPESEFAFLYTDDRMRIRVKTARNDIQTVGLVYGDHYEFASKKWYQKSEPMTKGLTTETSDYWELEVTVPFKRISYGFILTATDGEQLFYGDQGLFPATKGFIDQDNLYFRLPYFHGIDRFKTPDWVRQTVWYQIFPERFKNGDPTNDPAGTLPWGSKRPGREDFFGGDLKGIIEELDYLKELGVNGIYLCPIFTSPSNHKYDTVDYLEVDPHFGDKTLFQKLVQEAHKRDMKVMLDAVFNHLGASSKQWQDVLTHGADSRYADWFHIHSFPVKYEPLPDSAELAENITYDTFSFVPNMPKLNTANPEVQDYLLGIALYWIKEFDIDGWRLDVANEVDHHFWKKFHEVVLTEKSDLYILGEIWHSAQSWLAGDEFHAVMNYAFTDNMKAFFAKQKISASQMIAGMNRQQMLYRDQANEVAFNLLDSHDTPRILTVCGGDKELMKSLFAFLFLQKGTPCLYYGTEIGLEGEMDPDNRRCMVWDEIQQDRALFTFMQLLIKLRKKYVDLLSFGELHWVSVDDPKKQLIFERCHQGKRLRCIFNAGSELMTAEKRGQEVLSQLTEEDEKIYLHPNGFYIEEC